MDYTELTKKIVDIHNQLTPSYNVREVSDYDEYYHEIIIVPSKVYIRVYKKFVEFIGVNAGLALYIVSKLGIYHYSVANEHDGFWSCVPNFNIEKYAIFDDFNDYKVYVIGKHAFTMLGMDDGKYRLEDCTYDDIDDFVDKANKSGVFGDNFRFY